MFPERIFEYSSVREYRRVLVLQMLLILMFFVDFLSFAFAPVWSFLIFVALHIVVCFFWIRARCRLLDAFLNNLFE